MILAIDIGNSSINIGIFTSSALLVRKFDTFPLLPPAEYTALVNQFIAEKHVEKKAEGIIISSVVPGHTKVFMRAFAGISSRKPLTVSHALKTGLAFRIPNPGELGADRIANAAAAYEFSRDAVAVVDCGTATTISIVDKDGNYTGGAIMPGIRLMNESLARGASQLFEVSFRPPVSALGTSTAECIQAGLIFGTAGAVERILMETEKEAGYRLKIVVTGGYGEMMTGFLTRTHALLPFLTLEGLHIIYRKNTDA